MKKNKWIELITSTDVDEVPKGFDTIEQIMKDTGMGKCSLWRRFSKLSKEGKVEIKTFKIIYNGRLRHVPHYREIVKRIKK